MRQRYIIGQFAKICKDLQSGWRTENRRTFVVEPLACPLQCHGDPRHLDHVCLMRDRCRNAGLEDEMAGNFSTPKKIHEYILYTMIYRDLESWIIMNHFQKLSQKASCEFRSYFFGVPGKVEVDIQLLLQLQEQLITSANAIAAQLEEPEASRVEGIWTILQNEANMLMILQIMRISLNGWMLSWNLIMEWITENGRNEWNAHFDSELFLCFEVIADAVKVPNAPVPHSVRRLFRLHHCMAMIRQVAGFQSTNLLDEKPVPCSRSAFGLDDFEIWSPDNNSNFIPCTVAFSQVERCFCMFCTFGKHM